MTGFDPRHHQLPQRFAVAVSGRGSNLKALIERLDPKLAQIAGVFCSDPDAKALEIATAAGIPTYVPSEGFHRLPLPERDDVMIQVLGQWNAQWLLLAGYRRLIGVKLLQAFAERVVNIHPSLLPAFPGERAARQAVNYGVKVAGATVHFVNEGVDQGPIVAQVTVPVDEKDTEETLAARVLKEEHELYARAIHQLLTKGFHISGRRVVLGA